jgi:mercuric ion transport protein
MKVRTATLAGSVVGGFLASVCCIVPLAFAFLGLSGAAFAVRLEPMRPYLLVVTYGLLAGAFYLTYRPAKAGCAANGACAVPQSSAAAKVVLWIATVVVLLTTTFPLYSPYLF